MDWCWSDENKNKISPQKNLVKIEKFLGVKMMSENSESFMTVYFDDNKCGGKRKFENPRWFTIWKDFWKNRKNSLWGGHNSENTGRKKKVKRESGGYLMR